MSATTVLDVAAVDAGELAVACEDAATYEYTVFVVGIRASVVGIIVGVLGFGDVAGASPSPISSCCLQVVPFHPAVSSTSLQVSLDQQGQVSMPFNFIQPGSLLVRTSGKVRGFLFEAA